MAGEHGERFESQRPEAAGTAPYTTREQAARYTARGEGADYGGIAAGVRRAACRQTPLSGIDIFAGRDVAVVIKLVRFFDIGRTVRGNLLIGWQGGLSI